MTLAELHGILKRRGKPHVENFALKSLGKIAQKRFELQRCSLYLDSGCLRTAHICSSAICATVKNVQLRDSHRAHSSAYRSIITSRHINLIAMHSNQLRVVPLLHIAMACLQLELIDLPAHFGSIVMLGSQLNVSTKND